MEYTGIWSGKKGLVYPVLA